MKVKVTFNYLFLLVLAAACLASGCKPQLANAFLVMLAILWGESFSQQETFTEIIKSWLIAWLSLVLFYFVYYCAHIGQFAVQSSLAALFPVLTTTAPLLTSLLLGQLVAPSFKNWLAKTGSRTSAFWLTAASLAFFCLTCNKQTAVSFVLPFLWGLWLKQSGQKRYWLVLPGVMSIALLACLRTLPLDVSALTQANSPLLLLATLACATVLLPSTAALTDQQVECTLPALAIGAAPLTNQLWPRLLKTPGLGPKRIVVLCAGFALVTMLLAFLALRILAHKQWADWQTTSVSTLTVNFAKSARLFWQKHAPLILLWASAIIVSGLALLAMTPGGQVDLFAGDLTSIYPILWQTKRFVPLLSAAFIMALFAIFYFITTRFWVATGLAFFAAIALTVADRIKLSLRGEPVFPVELKEAINIKSLLSFVTPLQRVLIALLVLVLIALIVWLEIKKPVHAQRWPQRLIWAITAGLFLTTPLFVNERQGPKIIGCLYAGFGNDPQAHFANQKLLTQLHGPILAFADNVKVPAMDEPAGYSKQQVQQATKQAQAWAQQINKSRRNDIARQTVVMNLSESFVDPRRFPGVSFGSTDPIPFIRQLSHNTTSGWMLSAGYGGGTANMEYESLTGAAMGNFLAGTLPYTQVVTHHTSYPNIGSDFAYAAAIHPFIGTYYSRQTVYRIFGFKKFAYLGSPDKIRWQKKLGKSPYLSDETGYQNTLAQIKARKGGQFINYISMQNHMPYNNWYPHNEFKKAVSGQGLSPEEKTSLATFAKGTSYTDQAVKQFIQQIDGLNKPVTLVFYGDHYPAILPQSAVTKHPLRLHETNYFIYSNRYARAHGAKVLHGYNYVNTSSFIPLLLAQTNSKVTPYEAVLTKVAQELPAETIAYDNRPGSWLVSQKGQRVKHLTKREQKLLATYRLIQYDQTVGRDYGRQQGLYQQK